MNLIEQLGGYEKAKWWEHHLIEAEKKGIHHTGGNSALLFTLNGLQIELLEHRRAKNIFEVGDWVVFNNKYGISNSPVIHIHSISGDMFQFQTTFGLTPANFEMIRHATDAEIKVGRRL